MAALFFYITPGSGGLNGLEAAPTDQGSAEWGCDGTSIPGATSWAIGDGAANTAAILAEGACATGSAAELALNYAGGGCTDWYLPSLDELNELYLQRTVVGGFANTLYWSSSEIDAIDAWVQNFLDGIQNFSIKNGASFGVRAVRDF